MEDHEILSEITTSIPENEILLSFNEDLDALMFQEWWNEDGCGQFMEWAEQQRDETE